MSGKTARAARRQARASAPAVRSKGQRRRTRLWSWQVLAVLGAGLVLAGSFVLPGVFDSKQSSGTPAHAMPTGENAGEGLPAGSAVPAFAERDLLTDSPITSKTVYGQKTLLFFSEGVMCQACFQQIQGLQKVGAELERRGIRLVSITPDTKGDLEQAARLYGITTPLISDDNHDMSAAFNTLGKGMHADTPGHAFALISGGKVLWYRDYWLPPDQTMYVSASKLLADLPA